MKTVDFVTEYIKRIECYPKSSATDPGMRSTSIWLLVTANQSCLKGMEPKSVAAPHHSTYSGFGRQTSICPVLHCVTEVYKTSLFYLLVFCISD